jgi:hypothetical protein
MTLAIRKSEIARTVHVPPTSAEPFSTTLATPQPIKVPIIRFTPPTPPRRFTRREKEDVGLDLETGEVVERFAFDLVFDDYGLGRFF